MDRYEKAKSRFDELTALRSEKLAKAKSIDRFLTALIKRNVFLAEFDNQLWLTLVDYAEVQRDGTITFHYFDGITSMG